MQSTPCWRIITLLNCKQPWINVISAAQRFNERSFLPPDRLDILSTCCAVVLYNIFHSQLKDNALFFVSQTFLFYKVKNISVHSSPNFKLLFFSLSSAELHVIMTLVFLVQMATPGRRLCTGGKEALWRLGTFAPGGSISFPLSAWGTPLRLWELSQVRAVLFLSLQALTLS